MPGVLAGRRRRAGCRASCTEARAAAAPRRSPCTGFIAPGSSLRCRAAGVSPHVGSRPSPAPCASPPWVCACAPRGTRRGSLPSWTAQALGRGGQLASRVGWKRDSGSVGSGPCWELVEQFRTGPEGSCGACTGRAPSGPAGVLGAEDVAEFRSEVGKVVSGQGLFSKQPNPGLSPASVPGCRNMWDLVRGSDRSNPGGRVGKLTPELPGLSSELTPLAGQVGGHELSSRGARLDTRSRGWTTPRPGRSGEGAWRWRRAPPRRARTDTCWPRAVMAASPPRPQPPAPPPIASLGPREERRNQVLNDTLSGCRHLPFGSRRLLCFSGRRWSLSLPDR